VRAQGWVTLADDGQDAKPSLKRIQLIDSCRGVLMDMGLGFELVL
jgi:hypothetical protein